MVGVRPVFPPLDQDDLGEEQHHQQDEDHLSVHLRVPGMLLVHPECKYAVTNT